MRTKRYIEGFW